MKSFVTILLISFFGLTLKAAPTPQAYDLKMELYINGKLVSSPKLIVKANEKASIEEKSANGEYFIQVIASESTSLKPQGILMKFIVGAINKDGEKSILSKPQVIANENEPAVITLGDNKTAQEISLKTIAKRK